MQQGPPQNSKPVIQSTETHPITFNSSINNTSQRVLTHNHPSDMLMLASSSLKQSGLDLHQQASLAQRLESKPPLWKEWLQDERIRNTIAGGGAGCVSSVITCPLDMVKIRLQNQAKEFPGHRRSAFITFDRIWKSEARIMTQPATSEPGALYHYRSTFDGLTTIAKRKDGKHFIRDWKRDGADSTKGFTGLVRTVPASALTILTFEILSGSLEQLAVVNETG
ncbi:hypothetical protein BSLG_005698 [Batrachochytrium salamandrivorans]|nr:hypothetical protein BSLG_005698 [Batrachochytrium salamandrivorans]